MTREQAKNIILTCAICSACLLAARLWIYSELMPDRPFSMGGMLSVLQGNYNSYTSDSTTTKQEGENYLLMPRTVLVHTKEGTKAISGSAKQLYSAHGVVKEELNDALSSGNVKASTAKEEQWNKAKENPYVLLDYKRDIPYEMYLEYLGLESDKAAKGGSFSFRYLLVGSDGQGSALLFLDEEGEYHRLSTGSQNLARAMEAELSNISSGDISYTFVSDLEGQTGEIARNMGLGSQQLVTDAVVKTPLIKRVYPMAVEDGSQRQELEENLLKVFGYNTATIHQYDNTDGTTMYVENNSTLRINQKGSNVEYKVSDKRRGISILNNENSRDGKLSTYEMVEGVYQFLQRLDSRLLGGEAAMMELAGVTCQDDTYTLNFTFECEGVEILLDSSETTYPVQVQVVGGYITRVVLYPKEYHYGELYVPNMRMTAAVAAFGAQQQNDTPKEVRLVYQDTTEEEAMLITSYILEKDNK